ncbi:MAG: hypothetical protein MR375_05745 [Veillonellaceae bacterium]|nr:hypothetical protein [Veillonellaceae bacterium]
MKILSRADALKLLPSVDVPEDVCKKFADAGIMTKVVTTDDDGETTVTYPWQMETFDGVPDEVITTLYTELRNFVADYAERVAYKDLDESEKEKLTIAEYTELYERKGEWKPERKDVAPPIELTTEDVLAIFAAAFARRFIYQWRRYH